MTVDDYVGENTIHY